MASQYFLRNAVLRSSIRPSSVLTRSSIPARSYASGVGTGVKAAAQDKEHATDKKNDNLNIQSDAVHKGKEAKTGSDQDPSTSQRDVRGSADKTKKEFPEAPDTIGMQDERGGKSH